MSGKSLEWVIEVKFGKSVMLDSVGKYFVNENSVEVGMCVICWKKLFRVNVE